MVDDDYELLPHEELERLRKEVEHLKSNPFSDRKQNHTLLESMDSLSLSINKLIQILEGAQDNLVKEYSESNPTVLLKQISDQNAKIAEGIVTVARMLKGEYRPDLQQPTPQQNNFQQQTANQKTPSNLHTSQTKDSIPPNFDPEEAKMLPPNYKLDKNNKKRTFLNKRSTTMANFRK